MAAAFEEHLSACDTALMELATEMYLLPPNTELQFDSIHLLTDVIQRAHVSHYTNSSDTNSSDSPARRHLQSLHHTQVGL